jgi:hypothetical protein
VCVSYSTTRGTCVCPTVQPEVRVCPTVQPEVHVCPTVQPEVRVCPTVQPEVRVCPTVQPDVHVCPRYDYNARSSQHATSFQDLHNFVQVLFNTSLKLPRNLREL